MTGPAKCATLALAAACLTGAGSAPDSDPSGYAVHVPVTAGAASAVQRLAIPAQVLAAARTANLADLRVFDARGRPMPVARIAPATPPLRRDILPVLPILGAADALNVTGVTLRLDGAGHAGVAQVVGTPTAAATPTVLGVLLDARRTTGTARLLNLDAVVPAAQPVTLTVEASTDLTLWRTIGQKVIYRAVAAGIGDGISLPLGDAGLRGDYLRITWRGASRLLSPVTIRRATLVTRDDSTTIGGAIRATAPPPADAHVVEFGLPFAVPVSTIHVVPTGGELIVPVRILGRDDREQPWTLLSDGTAALRGADRSTGGIALGDRTYRMLRIEADPRSAGFSAAPAITFDFARHDIAFLAAGRSPYSLAAGRAATTAAYLPLASLMTQATDGALATATTGATEGTGVVRLDPVGDIGRGRQTLLWGLLIGATAVLGAMAWSLWRRGDAAG